MYPIVGIFRGVYILQITYHKVFARNNIRELNYQPSRIHAIIDYRVHALETALVILISSALLLSIFSPDIISITIDIDLWLVKMASKSCDVVIKLKWRSGFVVRVLYI